MTYQQALAYLDSLVNYEKRTGLDYKESFKLEGMRQLSSLFGNPEKGPDTIHLSGTKGKGSVSSFINSILLEAGFKVGLYTSPHLFSFRERIRINGKAIEEKEAASLIKEIKPHVDMVEKKGNRPTYFEIVTMMAFLYFKRNNTKFNVLEVGMGGRLDSTNIAKSKVCVITPISYDHTQYLGSDLGGIAVEKCGIIKENTVVISSAQKKEAMSVIERVCREKNARLCVLGRDTFFEIFDSNLMGQGFRLMTAYREYPELRIPYLGGFQVENASCAIAAVEGLRFIGVFLENNIIKNGLMKARWPGRFQLLQKRPFIVVDGAQNADSIAAIKKALVNTFSYKRLFLVIGAMADKDIDGMSRELGGVAHYVVATKAKSERAASTAFIKEKIMKYNSGIEVVKADSVAEAIGICKRQACEEDLILITGSLYVVAEAMQEVQKGTKRGRFPCL